MFVALDATGYGACSTRAARTVHSSSLEHVFYLLKKRGVSHAKHAAFSSLLPRNFVFHMSFVSWMPRTCFYRVHANWESTSVTVCWHPHFAEQQGVYSIKELKFWNTCVVQFSYQNIGRKRFRYRHVSVLYPELFGARPCPDLFPYHTHLSAVRIKEK